jgi:hypothetical protein
MKYFKKTLLISDMAYYKKAILSLILVVAFAGTGVSWWNYSWEYRKPINITEQSGEDLSNFQVEVSLDTSTPISEGKMQNDCSDLRFVESGKEIDYWVESGCNTASTRIWLEVKDLRAGNKESIYVYYGNSSVSSSSDGDSTFNYFENFESYADWGDMQDAGWEQYDLGTHTIVQENGDNVLKIGNTDSSGINPQNWVVSGEKFSLDKFVMEADYKSEKWAGGPIVKRYDSGNWYGPEHTYADVRGLKDGSDNHPCGFTSTTPETNKWHHLKFLAKPNYLKEWINGEVYFERDSCLDNWSISKPYRTGMWVHNDYGPDYMDDLLVRKYTSPAPSTTVGKEVRRTICDYRGPSEQCIVNKTKNLDSRTFEISDTFISEESAEIFSTSGTTHLNVTESSSISGLWRGSFWIDTVSPVIRPSTSLRPENGDIVIGK